MGLRTRLMIFPFLALLLLSASALAQVEKGTFTGVVTDATGAVLPGVTITITNMETAEARKVVTGDEGLYRATNFFPGRYEIKAALEGFKSIVNSNLQLTVGEIKRVDFKLEVGEITEIVQVVGEAPAVNTEEGRISAIVGGGQVSNLPLNGRNIFQLAQLQPGVLSVGGLNLQASDSSSFVAQGNRHRGTNYLIDGIDNNDPGIGGVPTLVPSQDAVQEFRLSTTNFSPEFGRNAGAVVNVVTKRGGNEFHGSVYEFHRNDALDAREFTDEEDTSPLIQHQFGFTFGGPIKRNKAWFFGYYEGERVSFGESSSFQAESPEFVRALSGALADSKVAQLLRRHPVGTSPSATRFTAGDIAANIIAEGGPGFGGGFGGSFFADWDGDGDVDAADIAIARSFWTRVIGVQFSDAEIAQMSQRAEALWRLLVSNPSLPVISSYAFGPRQKFTRDQYSIRIDNEFNEGKDIFSARWTQEKSDQNLINFQNAAVRDGITDPFFGSGNNLSLSLTHIFSPRTTNEFRFGWNKGRGDILAEPMPLPEVVFIGPSAITRVGAYSGFPQLFTEHTFQWVDTISLNIGKHGIRFGTEFRRNMENGIFDVSSRGEFDIDSIGDAFLDQPTFLFIAFNPLELSKSPPECLRTGANCNWVFPNFQRGFRNIEFGVFFQDDWKVTRRLTLNYGIRYDLYSVPKEVFGRQSNWIPGQGNNIFERVANSGRFDPLGVKTGTIQFNPDLVEDLYEGDHNNFSPRFGFAWDPFGDGKTSIRGGYGLGYDRIFFNVTSNVRFNPPLHAFGVFLNFFGNNVGRLFDINNPNNRLPRGEPPSAFIATSRISLRVPDPDLGTSYVQNWFFGVQRELRRDLVVEANYVGSAGRKLSLIEDYNRFAGDRFGATDPFGLGRPADFGTTRLHPDFTGINFRANAVNSIFHSFQLQVQKKFSGGNAFQAAWTVSKMMDTDSDVFGSDNDGIFTVDPTRIFLERGLSALDATQRLAINYIWELPFFRDQQGFLGKVLGGWQINGIVVLQSGRPFSVTIPDTHGNGDFVGGDRPFPTGAPDRILGGVKRSTFQRDVFGGAPCSPSLPSTSRRRSGTTVPVQTNCTAGLFRGASYLAVLGETGALGRNTFRGPGFANVDFAVFKNIKVPWFGAEEAAIQFRAEFFNLFNRVNLSPVPVRAINSSNFGTVGSQFDAREVQFALKFLF